MAVAISPEETSFFAGDSPLRRSHSQPRIIDQQSAFRSSASASRLHDYKPTPEYFGHHVPSLHSTPSSSPQTLSTASTEASYASSTSSAFSETEDAILHHLSLDLPQYDLIPEHPEDLEPPASPPNGDSYTASSTELEDSITSSDPETPEVPLKGYDDICVQPQPSHHVDYLSHDWKEEDIWSSWRFIISRRAEYSNASRLENASWRTWMKTKNNLKTVSPETLNWLKDCDVTWLYGPLQPGNEGPAATEPTSSVLSKSNSFSNSKKPILKKRSMSEVMLQQSLSTASLLKQAAAAVQAQQRVRRPILSRAHTDFPAFPFASMSRDNSLAPSVESSGITSPNTERKHIHFNEQVEQCIAVDAKGDDEEEDDSYTPNYDDSDSDEGIVMKRVARKRRSIRYRPREPKPKASDSKTIAMLPSTTLKYREDSPERRETAMKHSYRSPLISPSSSQETLKPHKKSSKFFVDSDEDDESGDEDERTLSTGSSHLVGTSSQNRPSGLRRSTSTNSLGTDPEPSGMRRTPSGMFVPIEEGEQPAADGIFGRVIDTVNTARDIAHVIWNVGWRR